MTPTYLIVLSVRRGTFQRRLQRWRTRAEDRRQGGLRTCGQKLSEPEKDAIVEAFHKPQYADLPIRAAWVKMLDDGICMCSPATVFRVLEERNAKARLTVRRARPQRRPPVLEAQAINQVWTWDITYLPSPVRGAYFYLYTIQDLFSRRIVGWTVEASEDGNLAKDLFDRILSERIEFPEKLRVHADNGSPMRSKSLTGLFANLKVRCTHGRPRVSDDNAFIESWFSVLKGRASFPDFFADIEQARRYIASVVAWYNGEHMHSRLDYLTPQQMDLGEGHQIQKRRNEVIQKAWAEHPCRFGTKRMRLRVPQSVKLTFHETVSYA